VEARTAVSRRGSHIVLTIGSQMAVTLRNIKRPPAITLTKIPGIYFCQRLILTGAIVNLQGSGQLSISMTLSGLEPETCSLIA
jgi:hypothetical protein